MSYGRDAYSVLAFVFNVVKIAVFKGGGGNWFASTKNTGMSRMALVHEPTFIVIPYLVLSIKRKK